ncbi:hypothetical protein DRO69_00140 [Candidatus Bathyarchaeota archaeon]|nr:MAG: hypothetical protein DRO69_00140 [Candidatus Bathyarchaeota archaeon]
MSLMSKNLKQINLDEYLERTVVRRYEVEGILYNIHGEHATRTQMISEIVYEITDEMTEEEIKKLRKSAMKRERPEQVHTFPKDKDGNLLVPLGGKRGYIMGALRVALYDLYKDRLQDRRWEGYGLATNIEHGIFIYPEWVPVGKKFSNPPDQPKRYLVQTAGISKGVITVYYDYVEEAPFKITIDITNRKIPEHIFLEMLAHVQRLGIGPKGRGRIKFTKVVKTIDRG